MKLDTDKIAEAIRSERDGRRYLASFDIDDAFDLVTGVAVPVWLERDLTSFCQLGVEVDLVGQIAGVAVTAWLDAQAIIRPDAPAPFAEYAGRWVVVDWKTSESELDAVWQQRQLDSWQWRYYCSLLPPGSLFVYRGLSRTGMTREVVLKPDRLLVGHQVVGLQAQLDAFGPLLIWPQNMPFACRAYGRPCPYQADCREDAMPRKTLDNPPRLSYTLGQNLMRCPEYARRVLLKKEAGEGDPRDEETAFGSAVHRGLAEVWRQAFEPVVVGGGAGINETASGASTLSCRIRDCDPAQYSPGDIHNLSDSSRA